MATIYNKLKAMIGSGRNAMLHRNIIYSALLRCVGLGCTLIIVPVTINYLNNEVYGIWLTMSSILYWVTFFDVGLGSGMRNYLTKAISTGNYPLARAYLSSTLVILAVIAAVVGVLATVALYALDLNAVFNTQSLSNAELRCVMLLAVAFTLLLFVIKDIAYVFVALQRYAMKELLTTLGSLVSLIAVIVLTQTTAPSLAYVVAAMTITPVLIFLLASIPIFVRYPQLRPSLKSFDRSLLRPIVTGGIGFFFIQIASCLAIYGSSNFFITQFCGPSSVTVYNIAFRFFNLLSIAYVIVISPMWNAYTDAYVKGDMPWINATFRKALRCWALTVIAGGVMLLCCGFFYKLWVGNAVEVPFSVSLSVLLYISAYNLNSGITYLLNGLNTIRIQITTAVLGAVLFLSSVSFVGRRYGIEGITLTMATLYTLMSIIHYYQCRLLIQQRATGIWAK